MDASATTSAPPRKPLARPWIWGLSAFLAVLAIGVARLPDAIVTFIHDPAARRAIADIHADATVLDAVRAQNAALADLTDADAAEHDAQWVAERSGGGGPVMATFLGSITSARLRQIVEETGGAARHVIVMDAKGLAVAAPYPFHNWRQTPKPKFTNTYPRANAVDVGPMEWGHDRSFAACWRTTTLTDPVTGAAIGAVGVELDIARVSAELCRATR